MTQVTSSFAAQFFWDERLLALTSITMSHMHRPQWQKVAILFSAAWIVVVGVSTGVYAYHQFACKPTVELLADGTIIRHACIATALAWRTIAEMAGYLIGGVVMVSLLSWIFLGWPSDVLSRYFNHTRRG